MECFLDAEKPPAFLVGAGISIPAPSSLMSGFAFLEALIRRLARSQRTRTRLMSLTDSERPDRKNNGDFLRFEGLMQIVYENSDPRLDVLSLLADNTTPNENHFVLAELIRLGHPVLTTNFDSLIEIASEQMNHPCSVLSSLDDFTAFGPLTGSVSLPLFKLHGSLKRFDGTQWLDARSTVQATLQTVGRSGEAMNLEPDKHRVFREVLQNHDLIILGYSGYDDFDIGPMIRDTVSSKRLLWCNHHLGRRRSYSWQLLSRYRDAGDRRWVDDQRNFWRNREQYLYDMGRETRDPRKLFLVDVDTSLVIGLLKKRYGITPPPLGRATPIDRDHFFDDWARTHLESNWDKEIICAQILYSLSRYDEALQTFKRGLKIAVSAKNATDEMMAFGRIANVYYSKGSYGLALKAYEANLKIARRLRDRYDIATSLNNIGLVHETKGEYDLALSKYNESLRIKRNMQDRSGEAWSLFGIASVYELKGRTRKALEMADATLKTFEKLGSWSEVAMVLNYIGQLHHKAGRIQDAICRYQASLAIRRKLGDQAGIAGSLESIATATMDGGDWSSALRIYQEALGITEEIGGKFEASQITHNLGVLYRRQRDYGQAIKWLLRSSSLFKKLGLADPAKSALRELRADLGNEQFEQLVRSCEENEK